MESDRIKESGKAFHFGSPPASRVAASPPLSRPKPQHRRRSPTRLGVPVQSPVLFKAVEASAHTLTPSHSIQPSDSALASSHPSRNTSPDPQNVPSCNERHLACPQRAPSSIFFSSFPVLLTRSLLTITHRWPRPCSPRGSH